jgi:hypothetical protein
MQANQSLASITRHSGPALVVRESVHPAAPQNEAGRHFESARRLVGEGEGTGVRWEAKVFSGPTSKIAIVSPPLAAGLPACLAQCVRVPRVHWLQHCSGEYGTIASYIEVFNHAVRKTI